MKIYLAKSNKCNPDHVMRVRSILNSLDAQVMEFTGGQYSNKDLIESEKMFVMPDSMLSEDTARIGKGLAQQIDTFKSTNSADEIYIVYLTTATDVLVRKYVKIEVDDPRDWTNYGKVHFTGEPKSVTTYVDRNIQEML